MQQQQPANRGSWVPRLAFAVLIVAGIAAGSALWLAAARYVGSVRSMASLEVAISNFRILDDENPRAEFTLKISSGGAIPVQAQKCDVSLALGDVYVGSTQSEYVGKDVPAGTQTYAQQTLIEQPLVAGRPWISTVVIYLDAPQMALVRARPANAAWHAEAGVHVTLPGSDNREVIGRSIDFQESK